MWINTNKLLIIDDCDKPCAYLLCRELPNGKVIYINEKVRRRFPNIKKTKTSATITDFGFMYDVFKRKYTQVYSSRAHYNDGGIRQWQGKTEFTYKEIQKMQYID